MYRSVPRSFHPDSFPSWYAHPSRSIENLSVPPDDFLTWVLEMPRPAGSRNQALLLSTLKQWASDLSFTCDVEMIEGAALTWTVPDLQGTVPDLGFACHADTVDWGESPKRVVFTGTGKYATTDGDCLGADDGAGVWMLCELTRFRVPGRYLFFIDEEIGARGAKSLADRRPDLWPARILEFDRKGEHDVVWNHSTGPSCAESFASSVASLLTCASLGRTFSPSAHGVFTDISFAPAHVSAVNISCGYENAHSGSETLNWSFLRDLRDAVISCASELAHVRCDPKPIEDKDFPVSWWRSSTDSTGWEDADFEEALRRMEAEDEFRFRSALSDPFAYKDFR